MTNKHSHNDLARLMSPQQKEARIISKMIESHGGQNIEIREDPNGIIILAQYIIQDPPDEQGVEKTKELSLGVSKVPKGYALSYYDHGLNKWQVISTVIEVENLTDGINIAIATLTAVCIGHELKVFQDIELAAAAAEPREPTTVPDWLCIE